MWVVVQDPEGCDRVVVRSPRVVGKTVDLRSRSISVNSSRHLPSKIMTTDYFQKPQTVRINET